MSHDRIRETDGWVQVTENMQNQLAGFMPSPPLHARGNEARKWAVGWLHRHMGVELRHDHLWIKLSVYLALRWVFVAMQGTGSNADAKELLWFEEKHSQLDQQAMDLSRQHGRMDVAQRSTLVASAPKVARLAAELPDLAYALQTVAEVGGWPAVLGFLLSPGVENDG